MRRSAAAVLALLLAGCIPNSVLDPSKRSAEPAAAAPLAWAPAKREDVVGYFESEETTGEAAAALRRVYYDFAADGTYTGAALVQGASHPEFQTLSGKWTLRDGRLDLGDGTTPAKASAATGHLRLEADGGTVVLKRAALP